MWVSFEELNEQSRIWIYQSDKFLDEDVSRAVIDELGSFIENWEAHGKPLRGSAIIMHNRFLVIGLDEGYNAVTGCSTDAKVNAVKEIGRKFQIDFFDRTQLPFLVDNEIVLLPMDQIRKRLIPGEISGRTLTFDNLVSTKEALESSWIKPVESTWLSRYVVQQ